MLKELFSSAVSHINNLVLMDDVHSTNDVLHFVLATVACIVLMYTCMRTLYYFVFRGKYKTQRKSTFSNKSTRFERMRKTSFPPPYPNGWFRVCHLTDLDDGNIVSFTGLGHDLVIFKAQLDETDLDDIETSNSVFYDASFKVGALHAFCPHIGAHLGQGGKVVGDRISCPFHGWQFNTEGKVVHIPYLPAQNSDMPDLRTVLKKDQFLKKMRDEGKEVNQHKELIPGKIPDVCKTKSYETCIWNGIVFVWFDAEGCPPQYSLYETPHLELARMKAMGDKRYSEAFELNRKNYSGKECKKDFLEEWRYIGMGELEFTMHIAEMAGRCFVFF